ncbi:MAG TPA: GNAT family N-acetyltransferase [Acidisphaera sp.]|nr:GNAT family N-acetyltransferase [Acidisphaera sp.]
MSAKPVLRSYRPTDLDAVITVFLDAIREVASRDYDPAQVDAWAQADRTAWEQQCLSRPTWVAVLDEAIVGFADLEPDGHIDVLYVHPAYQGVGVASLLLERVEAAAMGQGLSHVFTEASLTARPFFERWGFQVLARQQVALRGQTLARFQMQKTIG